MVFEEKSVLITGGTGSLGKVLLRRLLTNEMGKPRKIIIFSRDEAKQHQLRLAYKHKTVATDEIIYHNFDQVVEFRIGDVRDYHSIAAAVKDADIIFNAAALKQVPSCEYFPYEAVTTTTNEMTRFLLSLDDAVNVIFAAVREARRGETYIPKVPSARVLDIAGVLIGDRKIPIQVTGIRPGEKVHEILVSEDECHRTVERGKNLAIRSILPELGSQPAEAAALNAEYSSANEVMSFDQLGRFLQSHRLLVDEVEFVDEFLQ